MTPYTREEREKAARELISYKAYRLPAESTASNEFVADHLLDLQLELTRARELVKESRKLIHAYKFIWDGCGNFREQEIESFIERADSLLGEE